MDLHSLQLAEKIAEQRRQAEEMEQARQDLYLEEQEEKERQREREMEVKRMRQREEQQRLHEQEMHFKQLRQQAEKEEEEQFKKEVKESGSLLENISSCFFILFLQMLAKFAEDDRIEQMNAQKRRLKQAEHKRAVEKLLEERRAQFAEDRVSHPFLQINDAF